MPFSRVTQKEYFAIFIFQVWGVYIDLNSSEIINLDNMFQWAEYIILCLNI